jgi:hypothetical protein
VAWNNLIYLGLSYLLGREKNEREPEKIDEKGHESTQREGFG